MVSSNVTFDEDIFPAKQTNLSPSEEQINDTFPDSFISCPPPNPFHEPVSQDISITNPQCPTISLPKIPTPLTPTDPMFTTGTAPPMTLDGQTHSQPEPDIPAPRRSTRTQQQPVRYGFTATASSNDGEDNPTYEKAMNGPDKELWLRAMEEEFNSFQEHNVGTLVERPEGANILGGMWVFSRPRDEHHRIVKYKARWVIFGNHQVYGQDYLDTYASVGKSDSWRILLAIAISKRWFVIQFDIKTAFLNGDMKDFVYCMQVRGFRHKQHPNRVWLLNRSLYGLKKGARRWQQHFEATIAKFELSPTASDPAVYVLQDNRGVLIIHLHVDDSDVFCSSQNLLSGFLCLLGPGLHG